jgi:undecaprenyl-phosphate galactose phosphotransferase
MIKLLFDLIISLLILIIFSPILILISIIIFFDGGLPILHKRRVHHNEKKTFNFYKFRTMKVNADDLLNDLIINDEKYKNEYDKYFKIKNDPRITKVGKFLRKTSLDELPQIINVLLLQMSLVGPRPKTPEELDKFFKNTDYKKLFSVKPGITCTWQVSERSNMTYVERRKLDLEYAKKRNFFLDLKILILTLLVPFKRNAF